MRSLPCESSVSSDSVSIESAANRGYTSTGIYQNSIGEYWAEVLNSSGQKGYINCSYITTFLLNANDVKISGQSLPTTITQGSTFRTEGTISATYNKLFSVYAAIKSGSKTVYSVSLPVNVSSFSLYPGDINNGMKFSSLSAGSYTYEVTATVRNHYCVNPKNGVSYDEQTVTLINQPFTVTASSGTSSSTAFNNSKSAVNAYYYANKDAFMYSLPSSSSQIVSTNAVDSGREIPLIDENYIVYVDYQGKNESGETWYHIKANTGFISDATDNVYVFSGDLEPVTAGTYCVNREMTARIAIRASASTSSSVLVYLNAGDSFTVNSVSGLWANVSYSDGSSTYNGYTRIGYAEYVKPITYSILYNPNGGYGEPAAQSKTEGTAIKLSSTAPSREGYTFKGWATSSTGSVVYQPGDSYTADKSVTLYAVWAAKQYTVTYDANGGTGAPSKQTKTYGTALTLSSTTPTRTGYTFKGWATSGSGSVAYQPGDSYTTESSTTLYAIWTAKTYSVTYDANGGTGAPSKQTKTYGTALTLSSAKPTRTGYTFKGWATSGSGSVAYQPGDSYTANAAVTLYAVWEPVQRTLQAVAKKDPTCTADGNVAYWYEAATGKYFSDAAGQTEITQKQTVRPALGHSYSDTVTKPTCTQSGFTAHICIRCGDSYQDSVTEPIPHSYVNGACAHCGKEDPAFDPNSPRIYASSTTCVPGETAAVTLNIANNPGLAVMKLRISYDPAVMTLTEVENANLLKGSLTKSRYLTDIPYLLVWANDSDSNGNGTIVTLRFAVSETAAAGSYSVSVEFDSAFDQNDQALHFAAENALIEVREYTPGDINDDAEVDLRDATRLLQYLAEWDVEINAGAADTNGDSIIDLRDATRLLQYLAEWPVILGK